MKFLILTLTSILILSSSCKKPDAPGTEVITPTLGSDRLLFTYKPPGGNSEIYSSKLDGSDPIRLTNSSGFDSWWPKASPDRTKILFYHAPAGSNEDYGQATLLVMNADGSNPQVLIAQGANSWTIQAHAEWSPSGNEFVMCGTSGGVIHVFVTTTSGVIARQLTTTGGWNCDPSWSPNGQKIIFNRCGSVNCHSIFGNLDIYTISSTDGSALTALTSADGQDDYDPYYSPDGTTISWLNQVNNTSWSGAGAWSIKKMSANGSSPIYLINDGNINSKPAWSIDGSRIYFHRMAPIEAVKWRLYSFLPDGTARTEISPLGLYSNSLVGDSSYPSLR